MTTVLSQAVARLLMLPTIIVAIAVLVKGYVSVGDGFSAGVIAAMGVLLQYIVFGYREVEQRFPALRYAPSLSLVGVLIALATGFVPPLLGDPILTHYPRPGEPVIHFGTVELLTAVAFDVGVFLVVFGFIVTAVSMVARAAERGKP